MIIPLHPFFVNVYYTLTTILILALFISSFFVRFRTKRRLNLSHYNKKLSFFPNLLLIIQTKVFLYCTTNYILSQTQKHTGDLFASKKSKYTTFLHPILQTAPYAFNPARAFFYFFQTILPYLKSTVLMIGDVDIYSQLNVLSIANRFI